MSKRTIESRVEALKEALKVTTDKKTRKEFEKALKYYTSKLQ